MSKDLKQEEQPWNTCREQQQQSQQRPQEQQCSWEGKPKQGNETNENTNKETTERKKGWVTWGKR